MKKYKYLILGAGPAGLSFANRLLQLGEKDFLVIEKNNEAGGLCRSIDVDNRPLDIGGGHFLDVKKPKVLEFLFGFWGLENWDKFTRNSQIKLKDQFINSPIESNIWQLPIPLQVEYLKSISQAGCNQGKPMPTLFIDWINWKLGDRIAEDYMIPYNSKMFGNDLNSLGTYWLNKLPNVSFEETLTACLEKKPYGSQPAHASFYYPKKTGYGELWIKLAEALENRIIYGTNVEHIDYSTKTVNNEFSADAIIFTIPWTSVKEHIGMPKDIFEQMLGLKHSSVVIEYHPENIDTTAQWIYYPDTNLSYHRILVRSNFVSDSNGYWTETNLNRYKKEQAEYYSYTNEYAYPLNTIGKQEAMANILSWAKSLNIYGLGRWGEWQHYNSDVVVELAINLAEELYPNNK